MPDGPYFDELSVGQEFGGAPGITLTSGRETSWTGGTSPSSPDRISGAVAELEPMVGNCR